MAPFSSIRIAADGTYYVSGQLPADKSASPAEQAASCLEAIDAVLAEAGLTRSSILKTTLFTTELSALADINGAYTAFFAGMEPPARSAFGVTALAQGADVEIDAYGQVPQA